MKQAQKHFKSLRLYSEIPLGSDKKTAQPAARRVKPSFM
jgi:hypothetical protein